jgi:hypothetical protein
MLTFLNLIFDSNINNVHMKIHIVTFSMALVVNFVKKEEKATNWSGNSSFTQQTASGRESKGAMSNLKIIIYFMENLGQLHQLFRLILRMVNPIIDVILLLEHH